MPICDTCHRDIAAEIRPSARTDSWWSSASIGTSENPCLSARKTDHGPAPSWPPSFGHIECIDMKRASLLMVFCVCLAGPAAASYELALVLQNYTDPNGSTQRYVTRWDPSIGASLGRFRAFSPATNLALNPLFPGTVDLLETVNGTITIRRMDYSTGLTTAVVNTSIAATTVRRFQYTSGGNMLLAGILGGAERVRVYAPDGTVLRATTLPFASNAALSASIGPDGTLYTLTRQPGTSMGSKFTIASHTNQGSVVSTQVIADGAVTTNWFDLDYSSGYLHVACDSLAYRVFAPVTGFSIGTPTTSSGIQETVSTMSLGHNDTVYGFGFDSATSRTTLTGGRIAGSYADFYNQYSGTGYGNVYDSVIVLAPEPASLVAVSVGVAALLRRRRR